MRTELAMGVEALNHFLARAFPDNPPPCQITEVTDVGVRAHLPFSVTQLRPGGTISGPTLMALADTAAYAAVLSRIGEVALAVTSSLTINFLRKPGQTDLWADAELLKLGRRQAVTEVRMRSGEDSAVAAHATITYAIPSGAVTVG